MKISLFKAKFDPVAQMVPNLDTNICATRAARRDKPVFREYFKIKFDRLAQMVQELGLNKRATCAGTHIFTRTG